MLTRFIVGPHSIDAVGSIRREYLRRAVQRVQELAAISPTAARQAADEVKNYVRWVGNLLSGSQRSRILKQIKVVRKVKEPDS